MCPKHPFTGLSTRLNDVLKFLGFSGRTMNMISPWKPSQPTSSWNSEGAMALPGISRHMQSHCAQFSFCTPCDLDRHKHEGVCRRIHSLYFTDISYLKWGKFLLCLMTKYS